MNVDIYIREVGGTREIRIPWLPDAINVETGEASMATLEILNLGEVVVPTGVGLSGFSWESVFPGSGRTDTGMLRGTWKNPSHYDNILKDWKSKRTELNLLVTGYPINKNVYLQNYTCVAVGGFGDLEYTVSFKEARKISVKSTKVQTTTTTTTTTTRPVTDKKITYTVKSGDTLWSIAEAKLGDGTRWTEIYTMNRTIIENIAKKRGKGGSNFGHWIFPGTVLTINISKITTNSPSGGSNKKNTVSMLK